MLTDLIRQFENHEKKHPGIIPDSVFFDFGNHDGHISISSIIHGNEVGSLPAILKLIDHLITKKIKYEGKISFILGNKKASFENKRYLQHDLNRSFGKNNPVGPTPGLETLFITPFAPFLAIIDASLTWVRWMKEYEMSKKRDDSL